MDLVLCGHCHVFERYLLIKGHYDDPGTWNASTMLIDGSSGTDSIGETYIKDLNLPNGGDGTIYVVSGNSGSKDDAPGLNYPAHYFGDGCDNCYGSFVLDIHGDTLRGRYLKASGEIADDFSIHKVGNVSQDHNLAAQKLEVSPNPFTDKINLSFSLPQASQVQFRLTDMTGRPVQQLHNAQFAAGTHTLSLKVDANRVPAGNYLLQLQSGQEVAHRKVVKLP